MAKSKTTKRAARPASKQKHGRVAKQARRSRTTAAADRTPEPEARSTDEIAEAGAPLRPPTTETTALARREARALVPTDALQVYMAEVHRHPLLSREEERQLAQRYQKTGDLKAAYRLVASNLRLVVKIANEYHRNPLSLLDLIQEGNIGLMQAVKKYDPGRGVKLSSYAAWWIRAYILRYIMDNWRLVKLGTTEAQRKLFFKLRQEQDRLISQGFEASPKLLAERLNVTEQDVVEMDQRLGHDEVSLDAPIGDDGTATRADRFLPSDTVPADVRLGNEELKRIFRGKLEEFAKRLQDKERFIFEKRLMADEPLTLQEIGDKYGISRERARQIEANLKSRIREHVRGEMPDFDLVAAENNGKNEESEKN
jgi:RNA polymerase sigma-32 factor